MFGLEGFGVIAGFVLTLLSTLLCVVYGAINWNRGYLEEDERQQKESWLKEEQQLEDELL
ncbi:MAG: hypothetical protein JXR59_11710 [Desulfuromonadaceae bacterium]|nr:hypothetical protein [Desulfuromonadaceae bacterium]